ncbi:MAG: hypothetical protein ACLQVN_13520 [Bryobacteraceae bacterium]
MISGKLVHLMETHEEQIIDRVAGQIRRDPEMAHLQAMLGTGLRQWHKELLENLSHWLDKGNSETLARHYQHAGRDRLGQGVPLHECVRDLCVLKQTLLDFVEEHTLTKDSMELYAEEELDRRVGRFFDLSIVHLVQGYESARHHAAAA